MLDIHAMFGTYVSFVLGLLGIIGGSLAMRENALLSDFKVNSFLFISLFVFALIISILAVDHLFGEKFGTHLLTFEAIYKAILVLLEAVSSWIFLAVIFQTYHLLAFKRSGLR